MLDAYSTTVSFAFDKQIIRPWVNTMRTFLCLLALIFGSSEVNAEPLKGIEGAGEIVGIIFANQANLLNCSQLYPERRNEYENIAEAYALQISQTLVRAQEIIRTEFVRGGYSSEKASDLIAEVRVNTRTRVRRDCQNDPEGCSRLCLNIPSAYKAQKWIFRPLDILNPKAIEAMHNWR